MGRTRLWQSAGSTLIQGASKRQRPFWADWLTASAVGAGASYALIVGYQVFHGVAVVDALNTAWIPAVLGSCIGAAPTIWISGKYGSLRRWPAGAVVGGVVALILAWGYATYLSS